MAKEKHMSTETAGDDHELLNERVIIPMTTSMKNAIVDFWHERRLNSKAEATRLLLESGLEAEKKRKK